MLDLARAQERERWWVEFAAVRRLASGQELPRAVTEANRPPLHITSTGGTVTVDLGDKVVACTLVDGEERCLESDDDPALAPAGVYATLTRLGAYPRRARAPNRSVAGETASCFRLVSQTRVVAQLGVRTELCWADDGVPLWSQLERTGGATDTRTAQRVSRRVPADLVDQLVAALEEEPSEAGG